MQINENSLHACEICKICKEPYTTMDKDYTLQKVTHEVNSGLLPLIIMSCQETTYTWVLVSTECLGELIST